MDFINDLLPFYLGLLIGIAIHLTAFILALRKKDNLFSWIILINFIVVILFYQSPLSLIIPAGYILWIIYGKIRVKYKQK